MIHVFKKGGKMRMKKNVLIVFFSHSGSTRKIAEEIEKSVGGDLLDLKVVKDYPREYKELVKQAKEEIKIDFTPELIPCFIDFSDYDIVFIGSPNWLNTVAPPVKSFLRNNNFTGKIIIPFCSHGGGGEGSVFSTIEMESKNVVMKSDLSIYGDGRGKLDKLIEKWIDKNGGIFNEN